MKKVVFLVLILLVVLPLSVSAFLFQPLSKQVCVFVQQQLEVEEEYKIPNNIPFTNEIANLYLGEKIIGHVVLSKKYVEAFECTEHENPTYNVYFRSIFTLKDLTEAESHSEIINEQIESGEIIVEPKTFGRKIDWFIGKLRLKMDLWFR